MKLHSLLVKFSHYMYKKDSIYQSFMPRNTISLVIRSLTFIFLTTVHGQSKSSITDSLDIVAPRLDNIEIKIDGYLDESVWNSATSRSGFITYLPVDGRPAEDDTEIRIWYSSTALYVGIIAQEIHGEVRSTLADRDKLENDDVGVEHAIVSFDDGNKQAVLAFYTYKDGKIYTVETGASNLPK